MGRIALKIILFHFQKSYKYIFFAVYFLLYILLASIVFERDDYDAGCDIEKIFCCFMVR